MPISIIPDKGGDGKITISELAAKAGVLPSAISRTLRGLEEKGYIVRNVNQKDRRNTYVELTAKGEETATQCKQNMRDTIDTMGSSLVKSMGIAYAVSVGSLFWQFCFGAGYRCLLKDEVKECIAGLQRERRHIGQRHYQMLLNMLE